MKHLGGESIAALLGGHIQLYTGDVSEMTGHLETGDNFDIVLTSIVVLVRFPTCCPKTRYAVVSRTWPSLLACVDVNP